MIGPKIVAGLCVGLVCLLLMPAAAVAQNTGIAGVVTDTSGAVLPGVTVEASSPALIEKVRTVVTDNRGLYTIVDVRPGVYSVTFTLPSFTTIRREGIEVTGSFMATVNAELRVGAVAETITVSGQSPTVDVHNVVQQNVLTDQVREVLPTGRSIQMMAKIIPGMVATGGAGRPSGQDVGGTSGERGQVMIHGSRPQDVTVQLDGLALNNALADGRSQGYSLNPTEAEEYVYETGALAADTAHGGVRANLIPKTGGNRFSGQFLGAYANGDLQSNNLTSDLEDRGLQAANHLEKIYDWNAAAGGPFKQDKLWFFASFRYWGIREQVTGLYRPIDPLSFIYNPQLTDGAAGNVDFSQPEASWTWLRYYGLRLTWQAASKHRFGAFIGHQPREYEGVSATQTREATQRQVAKLNRMLQLSWKSPVTSRLLLEAAWASPYMSGYQIPTVPSITPDTVSAMDTGTGILFRAAPNYYLGYYYQPSAKAAVSYVTGTHAAKFGVDVGWGNVFFDDQRTNGGMTYTLQNGVPRSITLVLSPRDERERFRSLGLYAQDQWTMNRLTINGGLRFDHHTERVPEQQSGPGPIVPFQTWPEVRNVPHWNDLSPRLGLAYNLFGDGKTALKMIVNRYVVRDSTGFANSVNPMLFNASANRTWTDLNRDYIPQADELGPLSNANFATAVPTVNVDDAIRTGWGVRPYNWEVSASIQQEVLPRASVNFAYIRRWYGNFTVTDNRAVTPASYDPFCITAPMDSRLPGGGGNQICDLFDLNPSKVGQVDNLRTSADTYGTQKETFDGIDVTLNVRLPRRVQLFGGVSSGTSNHTGNTVTNSTEACFVVDSPGALRFCKVEVPWRTQVKALGTVALAWGIDVGATVQSTPGPEILANYTVNSTQVQGLGRNLTSGTATVPLIQPGSVFGDRALQVDLRLSKTFRLGAVRLRAMLDIGNALNASTVLLQNNTYGSNWLRPAYIIPGRLVKPTVDITF